MAESRMGDVEACLDRMQKRLDRDISNEDGTVDDHLQDINDWKVLGTSRRTKTEDRRRAAKKRTMDDHHQDINDLRVLGTRRGGTMKMTRDNHQQDSNDQTVLGTRLGGPRRLPGTTTSRTSTSRGSWEQGWVGPRC